MHRFFCPSQNISSHKVIIQDPTQIHHIRDVLRLKAGDEVIVFDGRANEYVVDIEKLMPQKIIFKIKKKTKALSTKSPTITVACAIPKRTKMDDIVDKLTQLGVERIIPLLTERVIVRLDSHKKTLCQQRWKRISLSAVQQSQRRTIPVIDSIRDIGEVLSASGNFDLKLIPTLLGERKRLPEILSNVKPKNILVLIGPEGDFTPQEVALAKQRGCMTVDLGDLVLRVDTAAIAVASYLRLVTY